MPIMKKKVYENFTVVDNYYIDDIECKPECMGYLTYMLRKPENWNFTFKSIMKDLGVGERNVRTNIQRLEALKYIKRERSRDENGNFIWIYYIYNKPYDLDLNKENLPYARNGHVDGEHIQTDQIIINTNNSKDKIDKTAEAEIIPDEINHNKLTEELINLKYIDEFDGANLQYGPISKVVPGFVYQDRVILREKSKSEKFATIKKYYENGYYLAIEVAGATETEQHWVALDYVTDNKIIMLDPGSEAIDMWKQYDWNKTTQFVYFKATK